jgi:hypothetical protein
MRPSLQPLYLPDKKLPIPRRMGGHRLGLDGLDVLLLSSSKQEWEILGPNLDLRQTILTDVFLDFPQSFV